MKKFNYYGQEIEVPDYAKFIATDDNGEMWWYANKPNDAHSMWIAGNKNCGRVGHNPNVKNWRGSLREC